MLKFFNKKYKYGWFVKNNLNFNEVLSICEGYADPRIAQVARKKSNQVNLKSYAIILWLAKIASENNNKVSVLDFGGAFGVTYNTAKFFLPNVELNWNIIEQESYIKIAQQTSELKFFSTIPDIKVDVILASSSLQYVKDPLEILSSLLSLKPSYFIIDRTPFLKKDYNSILTIQKVNPEIYGFDVSYPCWIFNKKEIYSNLTKNSYEMKDEFLSLTDIGHTKIADGTKMNFLGSVWKRN